MLGPLIEDQASFIARVNVSNLKADDAKFLSDCNGSSLSVRVERLCRWGWAE